MLYTTIDEELLQKTLSAPPFVVAGGVANFRNFGGIPTSDPRRAIRPRYLFRSGEPTFITEDGKQTLRDLGISTIFDLRSEVEMAKNSAPPPVIDGVNVVHVPVTQTDAYDPVNLAATMQRFATNELEAFTSDYAGMLEYGALSFEAIFKHLRDKPDEPCLVHCTAGKDRAGVYAALVLLLLGAKDEDIIQDYSLTTFGLQPMLPVLTARALKIPALRDNWQGALNMGSARPETMRATLQKIREIYGGVENYLKSRTSLTDEDIAQIRKNLLIVTE